mmetsp:Transcript_9806/g.14728  ORF Transcript_9806/g.14728 Transcript_9806/m.14728 type:complete len:214 (-) Transcript_9806:485-1126(-)
MATSGIGGSGAVSAAGFLFFAAALFNCSILSLIALYASALLLSAVFRSTSETVVGISGTLTDAVGAWFSSRLSTFSMTLQNPIASHIQKLKLPNIAPIGLIGVGNMVLNANSSFGSPRKLELGYFMKYLRYNHPKYVPNKTRRRSGKLVMPAKKKATANATTIIGRSLNFILSVDDMQFWLGAICLSATPNAAFAAENPLTGVNKNLSFIVEA